MSPASYLPDPAPDGKAARFGEGEYFQFRL